MTSHQVDFKELLLYPSWTSALLTKGGDWSRLKKSLSNLRLFLANWSAREFCSLQICNTLLAIFQSLWRNHLAFLAAQVDNYEAFLAVQVKAMQKTEALLNLKLNPLIHMPWWFKETLPHPLHPSSKTDPSTSSWIQFVSTIGQRLGVNKLLSQTLIS